MRNRLPALRLLGPARLSTLATLVVFAVLAAAACSSTPAEPQNPAWADVAPIFRGACNGCHGWNAGQTGGGYRFDFYDVTQATCGDAALALGTGTILAGSPLATTSIRNDVVTQAGAAWPRMPPQPSPALPDWERDTIERWANQPPGVPPTKGPAPISNHPPTIAVSNFPATAGAQLSFTAVLDDPDGDSVIGVIEVNGFAFLMPRPGSFDVSFDSSTWAAGSPEVTAVLCDGWVSASTMLGMVQIKH
jgi:hypothetical protein